MIPICTARDSLCPRLPSIFAVVITHTFLSNLLAIRHGLYGSSFSLNLSFQHCFDLPFPCVCRLLPLSSTLAYHAPPASAMMIPIAFIDPTCNRKTHTPRTMERHCLTFAA